MPKIEDCAHSALIVSASDQFDAVAKKSLTRFITIEIKKSGALARRAALERDYDLVIINAPLPDENGIELSLDIAEKNNGNVLLVVPQDNYEDILDTVTDQCVLVITKPSPKGRLDKAIRLMIAIRNKQYALEKKAASVQEKLEELRVVSKAKIVLVEKKHMTEDDAHRYIGKLAMNNGVSRKYAAEKILDEYE
ncbi:MAG: ANTAR domain-containing protein [Lachnospiraceae bacterium]|nr:ANTAR domain-containing protein [Lachnospiraceae bacterium]